MVKNPPYNNESSSGAFSKVLGLIVQDDIEKLSDYFEYQRIVDEKGRYLHFDKFRYKVPPNINPSWAWVFMRHARSQQLQPLLKLGEPEQVCHYLLTPVMQKAFSLVDRHTNSAALDIMSRRIGEKVQLSRYLISDLIEDEAISSSQLEGSATTTIVAKEMLKQQRKPRTPDEKMIIGNYKMMQFAWEKRHESLSVDMIAKMHRIGTEGIDDVRYTPGIFRKTDDVVVVGRDDEIVHQPPPALGVRQRLKNLVEWVNTCHDDAASDIYIHPLVKSITLHFAIGYEHPFRDGNGRVARGLFYWLMFKYDYIAFRYISISMLLKKAPTKYACSYLYTETDHMDLTYFFDYQSRIIVQAIMSFLDAYKKIREDAERFDRWLWDSGLYGRLSDKQRTLLNIAKDDAFRLFTIRQVQENLGCSYNTAATTLNGLVDFKLFSKKKSGREWMYSMNSRQEILQKWQS
ncbi:Fic family protein [uncultured Thiothrix sp.]|uniref:Fic family protein n=1 Tax=uncultured Thiothrix sp. TaxID=223185 RepID=UPI00262863C7|nr:Fic family protein [uncultured Thiothrix sp.]HMT93819.1 Fic family protein [Thiolinea sp.]